MHFKESYLLALLLCFGVCHPARADDGVVAKESALKAAFLYNFAVFTVWPALPADTLRFCVLDSPPLLAALEAVKSKRINEHAIEVIAIQAPSQATTCQVLFVGNLAHSRLGEINRLIGKDAVLVVTEDGDFDKKDIIIVLNKQQGHFSFKINQTAAQARSLTLSSKLLKLATEIY